MQTFIQLKLFATLASYTPENADRFPIDSGSTVQDLVLRLGIPPDEAKLIFINNVRSEPETPLTGGERISIFPPVGGG